MIELENLNNRSLEDILDEAKKQIQYLSTEWTYTQESDPGITLVELFAWLKYVQHEYLNRMSPGVKLKFLELLNIVVENNRGSETLLEVSDVASDILLPLRTKWKGGNLIFENIHSQTLIKSKILSVDFENPEFPSQEEYYKFDGSRVYYLFGRDIDRKNDKNAPRRFCINFDSPLPVDSIINMYFSVYVGKGLKRNPIEPGDSFESMADVKWEYYGIEKGVEGWHSIQIVQDNTHNFLFSGIIKLKIAGTTLSVDGQYKIRALLVYDEYDYPPRINRILTNVFRVCQNNTMCENTIIKKKDILPGNIIKLPLHLAIYGENEAYIKKRGGWVKASGVIFTPRADDGETIADVSALQSDLNDFSSQEEALMIVSYDKTIKKKVCLGSGTGMSAQHIQMNLNNVLYDDFEIMVGETKDEEDIFFKWKNVTNFFSSGKFDRHYIIEPAGGMLVFGDHSYAMAPRAGKNNIRLCTLRYTHGEDSNVREYTVNSVVSRNKILKKARVIQIVPGVGGRFNETPEHAEARAANLFNDPGRAVTVDDYEKIVRTTPGLMFTNVKVLPNYMEGEDCSKQNCVTIAVRWNRKVGLTLPKSFEKNIMDRLDKCRLINTKIRIVSPEYVGLIISGDIIVDSSYRQNQELIENEIKDFIKNINKDLGQTLHFGDLFGMIDRLKYVSSLEKLRIVPLGRNIQKNVSEDVIIPPNGVYYVEKIDFNYRRSSEIYRS